MNSISFIKPNQVRSYLIGCFQKSHDLNKNCPPGLNASSVLSGWMQVEWGIPHEFCESDALQFLSEAAGFAINADYKKFRDERVNELVFADMKARINAKIVTPEWVTEKLASNPAKRVEVQELLGFNKGDFSAYLSGAKPIPPSRAILLFLFFSYG